MFNSIILVGSASEGYESIGPFSGDTQEASNSAADDFGQNNLGDQSWEIMDLTSSEQYTQENQVSPATVGAASEEEDEEDEE